MFPQNEVSHLVCECGKIMKLPFYTESEEGVFCGVSRVDIDAAGAALAGRAEGRYVSISFGNFAELDREALEEIAKVTARELVALGTRIFGDRRCGKLLVAGLGNREVTHDSLGARVCDLLKPCDRLAVFAVGVSGKSGIETADAVKAIVGCCRAELVIAIDSLAARSEERLGRVIQLADSGISPAGGVGRSLGTVDRESLDVPVISVGVPTALADSEGRKGMLVVGEDVPEVCAVAAETVANSLTRFMEMF